MTNWETACPKREDKQHCNCWYDGEPCCACGDNSPCGGKMTEETFKAKRGFAVMDKQLQKEIASKGGKAQGKHNNPGNFANNKDRAKDAGRKGGKS